MLGPPLAILAALVTVGPIATPPRAVRVVTVESRVAPQALATSEPTIVVRRDLERGIDAIDWAREGIRGPYQIHAVLAEAGSRSERGRAHASCTIRAVVRGPDGALLAVVGGSARGEARGEDGPGARASLERDVIRSAAGQAAASLPEAIRRAR